MWITFGISKVICTFAAANEKTSNMDMYAMTDGALMKQIGSKMKELRIINSMKQSELASASGVSVFTISAVENGKAPSMMVMIQLLRALGHLDYLDHFLGERLPSPIAYAKMLNKNKLRQRIKISAQDQIAPLKVAESEW